MVDNVFHVAGDGADLAFPGAAAFAVMTAGNDTLVATADDDVISTGDGEDEVHAGDGNDTIGGVVFHDPFTLLPVGQALGGSVIDTDGNAGDAFAVVGGDMLFGEGGDDNIWAGYDSVVDGGTGTDTVHLILREQWEPFVAHTILTWFNDEAVDVDLRDAVNGSVVLGIGGLGNLTVTLTGVEVFDIQFGSGSDRAFGGDFNDILRGGYDYDAAQAGDDELHGRGGNDLLIGELGDDLLYGNAGSDRIEGGGSIFAFFDDLNSDLLSGGGGRDVLAGGRGDLFAGGLGNDHALIDLQTATYDYTVDLDAIVGGGLYNFGDGNADPNYIHSGTRTRGIEVIAGLALGSGNDTVTGSARSFTVRSNDPSLSTVFDGISGGDGNDHFTITGRLSGNFRSPVDGGVGNDLLTLDGNYSGGFTLGFGSVSRFETIAVAAGHDYMLTAGFGFDASVVDASALGLNDSLTFTDFANAVPGLLVTGGLGDDTVIVGMGIVDGSQRFELGAGFDVVEFANALPSTLVLSATALQDVDKIRFQHADSGDNHYAITTNDANVANLHVLIVDAQALGANLSGTETLTFDGSAETDGAFVIYGGAGNDVLGAGALGDALFGGIGNDILLGYSGVDQLSGDDGADRLYGGYGQDVLTGGDGNDRFYFDDGETGTDAASADEITDFTSGPDHVVLQAIDADTGTGGNQAFTFIGASAFSGAGVGGELRYETTVDGILVTGDTDGDGDADFAIAMDNFTTIAATDFVL